MSRTVVGLGLALILVNFLASKGGQAIRDAIGGIAQK